MLVPVHPKIRLSFSVLRQIALRVCATFNGLREYTTGSAEISPLRFSCRFARGSSYFRETADRLELAPQVVPEAAARIQLPRYVGIVSADADGVGTVEVVVDPTGTLRNAYCLCVLHNTTSAAAHVVAELCSRLKCPAVPQISESSDAVVALRQRDAQ
jgi:hypothetical protein